MIHHGIKNRSARATGEVNKKRVFRRVSFRLNEVVKDLHSFIFSNSDVSFKKSKQVCLYELTELWNSENDENRHIPGFKSERKIAIETWKSLDDWLWVWCSYESCKSEQKEKYNVFWFHYTKCFLSMKQDVWEAGVIYNIVICRYAVVVWNARDERDGVNPSV